MECYTKNRMISSEWTTDFHTMFQKYVLISYFRKLSTDVPWLISSSGVTQTKQLLNAPQPSRDPKAATYEYGVFVYFDHNFSHWVKMKLNWEDCIYFVISGLWV